MKNILSTIKRVFGFGTKFIEPSKSPPKPTEFEKEVVNFIEPTDVHEAYNEADSLDDFLRALK